MASRFAALMGFVQRRLSFDLVPTQVIPPFPVSVLRMPSVWIGSHCFDGIGVDLLSTAILWSMRELPQLECEDDELVSFRADC